MCPPSPAISGSPFQAVHSHSAPANRPESEHLARFSAGISRIKHEMERFTAAYDQRDSRAAGESHAAIEQELDRLAPIIEKNAFSTPSLEKICTELRSILDHGIPLVTGGNNLNVPRLHMKIFNLLRSAGANNISNISLECLSDVAHAIPRCISANEAYSFGPSNYPGGKNFASGFIANTEQMVNMAVHTSRLGSATRILRDDDCVRLRHVCEQMSAILTDSDVKATGWGGRYPSIKVFRDGTLDSILRIVVGILGKQLCRIVIPDTEAGRALAASRDKFNEVLGNADLNLKKETVDAIASMKDRRPGRELLFQMFDALFPHTPLFPHDDLPQPGQNSTFGRFMNVFGR